MQASIPADHLPFMTAMRTDRNPSMDDKTGMDHWRCNLRYQGRRMSVVFSMGHGHNGKAPTVLEVLNSLFIDASYGGMDFEEFCASAGYDTDSRRANLIWKACGSIGTRLIKMLGDDYETLARAVEGL